MPHTLEASRAFRLDLLRHLHIALAAGASLGRRLAAALGAAEGVVDEHGKHDRHHARQARQEEAVDVDKELGHMAAASGDDGGDGLHVRERALEIGGDGGAGGLHESEGTLRVGENLVDRGRQRVANGGRRLDLQLDARRRELEGQCEGDEDNVEDEGEEEEDVGKHDAALGKQ